MKNRTLRLPVITNWASYTPAASTGTYTFPNTFWRRVGDSIEISLSGVCTGGGTGLHQFTLPSGFRMNTRKAATSTMTSDTGSSQLINSILGVASMTTTSSGSIGGTGIVAASSETQLAVLLTAYASAAFNADGNAFTDRYHGFGSTTPNIASTTLSLLATVPIAGWHAVKYIQI